jgi:hypothetical protein
MNLALTARHRLSAWRYHADTRADLLFKAAAIIKRRRAEIAEIWRKKPG